MLVTGLHGLRRGETDHLRPEDINIEGGYLDIRRHLGKDGTTIWHPTFGKERKVPIVEAAVPFLSRVRDLPTDKHGRVFGVHDRRKAKSRSLMATQITGNVRLHDLRHYADLRGMPHSASVDSIPAEIVVLHAA